MDKMVDQGGVERQLWSADVANQSLFNMYVKSEEEYAIYTGAETRNDPAACALKLAADRLVTPNAFYVTQASDSSTKLLSHRSYCVHVVPQSEQWQSQQQS